ncbi:beta-secretase 2 isoform X2 [Pimephales promelas]|uniref:beta-secretase 2 isoform X1 n=1 Tax=Pimephales promelas TaxID=90988 RepID=UPI00195581C5|nr:beta-secretase 2 isoform X1 [Pimephales promelas]XP_039510109.1 beta-secretase 2 isoform X2 [Pimephales promelas]
MRLYYRLLILSLSFWTSHSVFKIPLKIFSGNFDPSVQLDLRPLRQNEGAVESGLSLASDPAGIVNFLDMINNLKGDSGRGYYMEMVIGTPGQTLNILVDTGSSNFAVAAAAHPYITHYYDRALSSTYQSTGRAVAVKYTQGEWEGELGTDRITIPKGPNGTITINIASILTSEGFFLPGINWQGILGLAYPLLVRPDPSVEPFFNSVVRQTGIPDVFSLQMCGAGVSASTTADPAGGSLIMGGVEPTLYQGSVWYTPILEEWYYQVEVLKLEVGDQNLNLDCKEYNSDKAIVDSGTTLLRLPENVFSAVVDAIMQTSLIEDFSAGFFDGTKLACWMRGESPWRLFPKLSIYLRATNTSQSFRITIHPQLYVQPVTDIDGTLDCFRFGVSPSANGLVIGATVMEGFYVIFDRAQKRVGFAVSTCAENGGVPFAEIAGPFLAEGVASDCTRGTSLREPMMWVIAYTLMGVCAAVLIVLLILLILPCRCHRDGEITDESSLVRHRIK